MRPTPRLRLRFDEHAYLNAGLTLTLTDARAEGKEPRTQEFKHDGGIVEYVEHICEGKKPLIEAKEKTISIGGDRGEVAVSCALRWNADMYTDSLLGFANGVVSGDMCAERRDVGSVSRCDASWGGAHSRHVARLTSYSPRGSTRPTAARTSTV